MFPVWRAGDRDRGLDPYRGHTTALRTVVRAATRVLDPPGDPLYGIRRLLRRSHDN